MPDKYQPQFFEEKWQKKWKEEGIFSPNLDQAKKPYYALMMFPYPSAQGLHVGNVYAFTGADIFARFMRMKGYDVFEPIGLDGFGIHSENYAIKVGKHPVELSKITEKHFYQQLEAIGNSFDWRRTVETYKPNYYRFTQWIFLQMYKNGLAYRKRSQVNWCPSCKTVLADEQVIVGKCERCSSSVVKKMLEQWFFKITKYADRLLKNLNRLDWSQKVITAQKNWIGKKEGINISYKVVDQKKDRQIDEITCFTTRPDTNFGATFVVVAPEHSFVEKILQKKFAVSDSKWQEINKYVEVAKAKTVEEREKEGRKKTGVFTGFYALNQLNGYKMPIWVSDFVLMSVGTGAVVGVPGHDIRDFEFAKEFGIKIIRVVVGKDKDTSAITRREQVQEEEGVMINSGFLNGLDIKKAIEAMINHLQKKGWGKKVTTYHLRDWLISRQRYWGPPIPIIYCRSCWKFKKAKLKAKKLEQGVDYTLIDGKEYIIHPVPEEDLPVELPFIENFRPTGTGVSPLASDPKFYQVKCPKCGSQAQRETDVSDTFLDSAWYFLRYTSTEDETVAWRTDRVKKWLPVNTYIGGAEHSVLHLLYSRFLTMVFKDLGFFDHFEEPFTRFRAHGLIIAEGAKMSKSKGNVVNPDAYIKQYGADTLRLYLMFLGPFDQGGDFRDEAISGPWNFLKRVWQIYQNYRQETKGSRPAESKKLVLSLNKTISKVTADIPKLKYNTAIAAMMEFLNIWEKEKAMLSEENAKKFLQILAPFAPHITEEIWRNIFLEKSSIHLSSWPIVKEVKNEEVVIPVQVNGRLRGTIKVKRETLSSKEEIKKRALENEKVQKYLKGRKYEMIYVEGKVVNFVIRQ